MLGHADIGLTVSTYGSWLNPPDRARSTCSTARSSRPQRPVL